MLSGFCVPSFTWDSTLAARLMKPRPALDIQNARFAEDNGDIDMVPRVYIKAMHDNALKPEQRGVMIRSGPWLIHTLVPILLIHVPSLRFAGEECNSLLIKTARRIIINNSRGVFGH